MICLGTMLFYAIGGGGFLLLIVGYLEKHSVPVTEIGSVMSLLSIVEGVVCLLVGYLYRGKWTHEILICGLVFNGSSSLLLSFQPVGVMVWVSAALNGAGFGIFTVIMYVAALQRRPSSLNLGLAVGLYTACIAGGNGLGALAVGWMTDGYGFTVSFSFCVVCYLAALLGLLVLSRKPIPQSGPPPTVAAGQPGRAAGITPAWILALLTAFLLSSTNTVFDILFPVYALRAGMSFALVGSVSGIKMVLAALVRPFTGVMMARWNPIYLNHGSLAGLALGTALIPISGMGLGLVAVVAILGVMFGSVRTTSATLVVKDENNPQVVSWRISYYNTCLTLGQTVSPWFIGWIADQVEVRTAIMVIPLGILGLFGVSSILLPQLVSRWNAARIRTYSI